jgi:hypothetical protein
MRRSNSSLCIPSISPPLSLSLSFSVCLFVSVLLGSYTMIFLHCLQNKKNNNSPATKTSKNCNKSMKSEGRGERGRRLKRVAKLWVLLWGWDDANPKGNHRTAFQRWMENEMNIELDGKWGKKRDWIEWKMKLGLDWKWIDWMKRQIGLDRKGINGFDWMKNEIGVGWQRKGIGLDWMKNCRMEKERSWIGWKRKEKNLILKGGVIFWMVTCGLLNPLFFVLISWGCLTGPIWLAHRKKTKLKL